MLFKDGAVIILFLVLGWIDWESFGGIRHLFIGDRLGGYFLECIDPAIAYPIRELLFLPPSDLLGQAVGKCFSKYLLLDGLTRPHL